MNDRFQSHDAFDGPACQVAARAGEGEIADAIEMPPAERPTAPPDRNEEITARADLQRQRSLVRAIRLRYAISRGNISQALIKLSEGEI